MISTSAPPSRSACHCPTRAPQSTAHSALHVLPRAHRRGRSACRSTRATAPTAEMAFSATSSLPRTDAILRGRQVTTEGRGKRRFRERERERGRCIQCVLHRFAGSFTCAPLAVCRSDSLAPVSNCGPSNPCQASFQLCAEELDDPSVSRLVQEKERD